MTSKTFLFLLPPLSSRHTTDSIILVRYPEAFEASQLTLLRKFFPSDALLGHELFQHKLSYYAPKGTI